MKFLIANPAGLWALLAVPAIVLIHMLQERARRVRVSTLFLLERVKPESIGGSRLERLRNSLPLWLQIIAALLLTWLLCEPRWIRKDARQTVVVVLDSSASMSAFKEETRRMLSEKLSPWTHGSGQTDWRLLESAPRKPTLYAGPELSALLAAVSNWEPLSGRHAPDDVLQTARSLIRNGAGTVIFVTDRKTALPDGVGLLSAGEAIENTGFAGLEIKMVDHHPRWSAMVKNYGRETAQRDWWIEREDNAKPGTAEAKRHLTIEPGRVEILEGEFPDGVDRFTLVLSGDRFALDDRLPLQRPVARTIGTMVKLKGHSGDSMKKMLGALEGVEMGSLVPDLVVDELGTGVDTNAVQISVSGEDVTASVDPGWVASESNALTRDLAWSSLLCSQPSELTQEPDDEPLLWKDGRMLALVRPGKKPDGQPLLRLILNWDLAKSNADRLPAMLVLLQRFVERLREAKNAPWAGNFELSERFTVAQTEGQKVLLKTAGSQEPFAGVAPERPQFFDVLVDGKKSVSGAVHFADTRVADFKDAAPLDTTGALRHDLALQQTQADPFMPVWVLAVLACLLGSWAWKSSRKKDTSQDTTALPTLLTVDP